MISAKSVILTAIYNKGTEQVRAQATEIADWALCSKPYVISIIRKVEKGQIIIRSKAWQEKKY